MRKCMMLAGAVAVMLPLFAFAAEQQELEDNVMSVDAHFDKTGDGIVDASDWKKMTADEQESYARESLKALGQDPEALLLQGKNRMQKYLEGLRSVYE